MLWDSEENGSGRAIGLNFARTGAGIKSSAEDCVLESIAERLFQCQFV